AANAVAAPATEGRDVASAGGAATLSGASTGLGAILVAPDGRSTMPAATPANAGRLAGPTGAGDPAAQGPADRRGGATSGSPSPRPDLLSPASLDPAPNPSSPPPLLADVAPGSTPVAS